MTNINEDFSKLTPEQMPNHVAIIPNGNRTWAKQQGLSNQEGHNVGVEVLIKFSRIMRKWGVHTATVWASSTDNFAKRPPEEMANLIRLLHYVLDTTAEEAEKDGARLIHLGNRKMLPEDVVKKIEYWEERTHNNTTHVANIAFAYGGHDELLRGFANALKDMQEGKLTFEDLYSEVGKYHGKYPYFKFKDYLDTKDQPFPFPDLIIRNSGESRLSGFMPWQSVYSEIYVTDKLLPEMTEEDFKEAILFYSRADRSFGGSKTKS